MSPQLRLTILTDNPTHPHLRAITNYATRLAIPTTQHPRDAVPYTLRRNGFTELPIFIAHTRLLPQRGPDDVYTIWQGHNEQTARKHIREALHKAATLP